MDPARVGRAEAKSRPIECEERATVYRPRARADEEEAWRKKYAKPAAGDVLLSVGAHEDVGQARLQRRRVAEQNVGAPTEGVRGVHLMVGEPELVVRAVSQDRAGDHHRHAAQIGARQWP